MPIFVLKMKIGARILVHVLLSCLLYKVATPMNLRWQKTSLPVSVNRLALNIWNLGKSVNLFGLNLLKNMDGQNRTEVMVSPFPVAYGLAAMATCTRGTALLEICDVLGLFNVYVDEFQKTYPKMCQLIQYRTTTGQGASYNLSIANRIYMGKDIQIVPRYQYYLKKNFNLTTKTIDFSDEESASSEINKFVDMETNGNINNFIDSDKILMNQSGILLVSAASFRGEFDSTEATSDGSMIKMEGTYLYTDNSKLKAVQLPLAGNDITLVFVIPKEVKDMQMLKEELNGDNLAILMKRTMKKQKVSVTIPTIDYTSPTYSLKDTLSTMGLSSIFESHITMPGTINGMKEIYVSDVLHKTKISISLSPSEPNITGRYDYIDDMFNFNLDNNLRQEPGVDTINMEVKQPFLFFVVDKRTEMVLYAGISEGPVSDQLELSTISVTGYGTTLNEDIMNGIIPQTDAYSIIDNSSNDAPSATTEKAVTSPTSTPVTAEATTAATVATESVIPISAPSTMPTTSTDVETSSEDTLKFRDIPKQIVISVKDQDKNLVELTSAAMELNPKRGKGQVTFFKL